MLVNDYVGTMAAAEAANLDRGGRAGMSPLEAMDAANECPHGQVPGATCKHGCFGAPDLIAVLGKAQLRVAGSVRSLSDMFAPADKSPSVRGRSERGLPMDAAAVTARRNGHRLEELVRIPKGKRSDAVELEIAALQRATACDEIL